MASRHRLELIKHGGSIICGFISTGGGKQKMGGVSGGDTFRDKRRLLRSPLKRETHLAGSFNHASDVIETEQGAGA